MKKIKVLKNKYLKKLEWLKSDKILNNVDFITKFLDNIDFMNKILNINEDKEQI